MRTASSSAALREGVERRWLPGASRWTEVAACAASQGALSSTHTHVLHPVAGRARAQAVGERSLQARSFGLFGLRLRLTCGHPCVITEVPAPVSCLDIRHIVATLQARQAVQVGRQAVVAVVIRTGKEGAGRAGGPSDRLAGKQAQSRASKASAHQSHNPPAAARAAAARLQREACLEAALVADHSVQVVQKVVASWSCPCCCRCPSCSPDCCCWCGRWPRSSRCRCRRKGGREGRGGGLLLGAAPRGAAPAG